MRRFFYLLFSTISVIAITSCDPLEPSRYTTTFNRLGTVKTTGSNVQLNLDYTGEEFLFSNFNTISNLEDFNVTDGDRVVANMTLTVVGNIPMPKLYMNRITKLINYQIDTIAPSDTLNHYFRFGLFSIDNSFSYPQIWSSGHHINVAPITNPSNKKGLKYHLYPISFSNDTLRMRLSANVPDNNRMKYEETQTLLSYDMSSLRTSVSDEQTTRWKDSIINHIETNRYDSIYIAVSTHDSLWYHYNNTVTWIKGGTLYTRIPFDF